MTEIFEIEKQMEVLKDSMTAINDKALDEKRDLTEDEQKAYDEKYASIEKLKIKRSNLMKQEELNKMEFKGVRAERENASVANDQASAIKQYIATGTYPEQFKGDFGNFALKANPVLTSTATGILEHNIEPTSLLVTEGLAWAKQVGFNVQTGITGRVELPRLDMLDSSVFAESDTTNAITGVTIANQTVDPSVFKSSVTFSKPFLLNANADSINKIMGDLQAANERKLVKAGLTLAGAASAYDSSVASTASGLTYKDLTNIKKNTFINLGKTAFITTSTARAYLENLNAGGAGIKFVWSDDDKVCGQPAYAPEGAPANKVLWGDWSNEFIGVWGNQELVLDTTSNPGFVKVTALLYGQAAIQNYRGIKYSDVSAN